MRIEYNLMLYYDRSKEFRSGLCGESEALMETTQSLLNAIEKMLQKATERELKIVYQFLRSLLG
nr:MAG TPA: hypothetical protein [Caudoviricetes sp.]